MGVLDDAMFMVQIYDGVQDNAGTSPKTDHNSVRLCAGVLHGG